MVVAAEHLHFMAIVRTPHNVLQWASE